MEDWTEITAWRKQQRAALLARREALPAAERRAWSEAITAFLEQGFPVLAHKVVGFCWPYKAEFDPRFAMRHFRDRGAVTALPEVVDKHGPLQFSKWWPGAPMRPGVYDIPVPDGTEVVVPEAAIVPMVGFDEMGYRLGYGGGYFDRTLAAIKPRPLAVGVSYEALRLATIHPQPHDVPMNFVVTERGIYRAGAQGLTLISAEACDAMLKELD